MADLDPDTTPSLMPADQAIAKENGKPTTPMLNWFSALRSWTKQNAVDLAVPLLNEAGDPLDLTGKAFEYILWGCGENMRLNDASGLSVDLVTSIVSVAPAPERRLRAGTYQHGLRSTDASNIAIQHFDGEVSVSKGGF